MANTRATETTTDSAAVMAVPANAGDSRGVLDVNTLISGLNGDVSSIFTTINGGDFDSRLKVAAAISDAEPFESHLGENFDLAHVIIQQVDLEDANTGEITTAPRVILISDTGTAIVGTSVGLAMAVRNLFLAVGSPENWEHSISIKLVREGAGIRKYFTFKVNV